MKPALGLQIAIAFGVAVVGGLIGVMTPRTPAQLWACIGVGAGALLAVTVAGILPESLATLQWWQAALAIGAGYALFAIVTSRLHPICPACAANRFGSTTAPQLAGVASAMMIALAIHCAVDGAALAVGSHAGASVGRAMAFAVCAHKLPEGVALGALLLGEGLSSRKALSLVALTESATAVGGVGGKFVLSDVGEVWLSVILAVVAGGFVYLAARAVTGRPDRNASVVLISFGIGFGGIVVLILAGR